jgi:molybdate/tungstate transport system permease protein
MKRRPDIAFWIFALLGGLLLLDLTLPIANLFLRVNWHEVRSSLGSPGTRDAIRTSLISSTLATAIITFLGVPLGYLLARARIPGWRFLASLVFVPLVLPPLVGGILLLLLFGPYGVIGSFLQERGLALYGNLAGIVLAQTFVAGPFVVIAAISAFESVDEELEQAAATLGDSRWQIFRCISLPLAWPGIAAGVTLAWMRSLGEFGATLVLAYNPHSVPVFLWISLQTDGLAGAFPLALFLVALSALAMTAAYLLGRLRGSGQSTGFVRELWKA